MNRIRKIKIVMLSVILISIGMFAGCGSIGGLKDGFYTAEMSEFSHGWQEYLIIQVKGGKIVSAEFNAKNESGFIKAWDNSYMKNMASVQGTYPNKNSALIRALFLVNLVNQLKFLNHFI